jgi:CRISPR-associated protein Csd1
MLHHLLDYAERHGLVAESGFAPRDVRWAISCDGSGRFLGVVLLGQDKKGRHFPRCPQLTDREVIGRSHFLVESLAVAVLLTKDGKIDAKTQRRHDYFVNLLRQAGNSLPHCSAAARMLADAGTLAAIHASPEFAGPPKARPTDLVTFEVNGQLIVETDEWIDWWREFRRQESSRCATQRSSRREQRTMRCLLTGEPVVPAATHEKVTGLAGVGGRTMGDALISFDKDAFTSFGLAQSANAAMGEQTAKTYREALNHLIRNHGQKLAGAMVVHWFKSKVEVQDDPFAWLDNPSSEEATTFDPAELAAQKRAAGLLRAIETGQRPDLSNNEYYALAMSGAAGRVMVRDWMQGGFAELVNNVSSWFDDLAIVRREGGHLAREPKFLALIGSLYRDLNEASPALVSELWRSAVRRRRIPRAAVALALARFRNDLVADRVPSHARLGVLKAYTIRNTSGGSFMTPYLNEDHPAPAYHAGRLLAILAALQWRALGDVGAGVVQRYYIAASQMPALVFGRLIGNAKNHLNKLDPKSARFYERRIGDVVGRLGDSLPRTLDLEHQTVFALGYYQQLAHQRSFKATPSEPEEKEDE